MSRASWDSRAVPMLVATQLLMASIFSRSFTTRSSILILTPFHCMPMTFLYTYSIESPIQYHQINKKPTRRPSHPFSIQVFLCFLQATPGALPAALRPWAPGCGAQRPGAPAPAAPAAGAPTALAAAAPGAPGRATASPSYASHGIERCPS